MRRFAGVALVGTMVIAVAVAVAKQPPPVIRNLGPYAPTPAPSPGAADKIRMVTSFTLRNSPEGPSLTSFEITDMTRSKRKETDAGSVKADGGSTKAKEGDKSPFQHKIIATEIYSLSQGKKELAPLRDEIMRKVRDLEVDLIEFAQRVGPPKERAKIGEQGPSTRPR